MKIQRFIALFAALFVTVVTASLFACDFTTSNHQAPTDRADDQRHNSSSAEGDKSSQKRTIEIRVLAKQYEWYIQYPGKDGKLGKLDMDKRKLGPPDELFGLDRSGVGEDDVITGWFVLPIKTHINLEFVSVDVPHRFVLPNANIDQKVLLTDYSRTTVEFERPGEAVEKDDLPDYIFKFFDDDELLTERFQLTHKEQPFHCTENCGIGSDIHKSGLFLLSANRFGEFERLLYSMHAVGVSPIGD